MKAAASAAVFNLWACGTCDDLSPENSSKSGQNPSPGRGTEMKPSRYTEEQIIEILREQEAGATTTDVSRK
jgi:hypothetical protein